MMTLTVLAAMLACGWIAKALYKALAASAQVVAEPARIEEAAR